MADREAKVLIGVETDTAKAQQGFADVGASITGLETKVDRLAQTTAASGLDALTDDVRDAFKRAEMAADNFQSRLENGAVTGPRDLRKVAIAQELLTIAIEKSGKELKDLGPAAQAAYAKLEKAQKDAIVTTSRIKEKLEDVNTEAKQATPSFNGFGDALQRLGGQTAKMAEGMAAFTGALAAGWAIGEKFKSLNILKNPVCLGDRTNHMGNFYRGFSRSAPKIFCLIRCPFWRSALRRWATPTAHCGMHRSN